MGRSRGLAPLLEVPQTSVLLLHQDRHKIPPVGIEPTSRA